MAIFKCKMCGGALEINNETVAACQYCGTKQTLPRLDDDRKANLYDRANHFRRNNEFDKAMGIYEQILNEDSTDAESYWSLVLCRYGIEYVEDPSSHKRIPTINRAQFTSIFDDEDYKSALQYANGYQREVYEQEANAINDIQKGILAISQKEEPFDVFICYKETDNSGRRTPDSVLATELYNELTREGFKVFFARITLEDKLGQEYEPYIFAALNSAKVMVVLGTEPEFFNAVWVKNEWSRYLALIKNGARKMLIPAYKDMNPYDLPEEFSHLQAQDMSKLGFMQDLIRGIKKIVEVDIAPQIICETIVANETVGGNITALLKRGYMALEDGEWHKADDFFEQALNQNAELAEAYLGKLMVELQVEIQESLKDYQAPFDNNPNFQKALRFANDKLKFFLENCIRTINEKNHLQELELIYQKANDLMEMYDESGYCEAKLHFEKILDYKDSDKLAKKCDEKAEEIRLKKERKAELESIAAEKRKNQNKKLTIIVTAIVAVCVIVFAIFYTVIIPNEKYNKAIALYNQNKFDESVQILKELDGYKNSEEKIREIKYANAIELKKNQSYSKAITLFSELGEYKDSAEQLQDVSYSYAVIQFKNTLDNPNSKPSDNIWTPLLLAFEKVGDYKDSHDYISYCKGMLSDNTDEVLKHFKTIPTDFYDCSKRIEYLNSLKSFTGEYKFIKYETKCDYSWGSYDYEPISAECYSIWNTDGNASILFKFMLKDKSSKLEHSFLFERVFNYDEEIDYGKEMVWEPKSESIDLIGVVSGFSFDYDGNEYKFYYENGAKKGFSFGIYK